MKKTIVTVISMVLLAALVLSGCTKNNDASTVAEQFNADLTAGKAFVSSHLYLADNETVVTERDKDGNIHVTYTYEGGVDDFYFVEDAYTYYFNNELMDDLYTDEEMKDIIDGVIQDVLFYPEDAMQAFALDIDSDVLESEEKNAYAILGEYEDGSNYGFYYGMDGTFFELLDEVDVIRTDLDESVVIELP